MLARLRPVYNKIVVPLGNASIKLGLTPDFWTFFSLACAAIAGVLLWQGQFWLGFLFSLIMYAADMLDGATARAGGISSQYGTVLDHVVDRYAEFMVISGLLIGSWISSAAAMFSASGVVMASYIRAKAESAGGLKDCGVGIAGRAEKLILINGAIIMLGLGYNIGAEVLIWIVGLISHITLIQRLLYAKKNISRVAPENQA